MPLELGRLHLWGPATNPPEEEMRHRRTDDQAVRILLTGRTTAESESSSPAAEHGNVELLGYEMDSEACARPLAVAVPQVEPEDSVFLLDMWEDEAVLVAGAAIRRLPRGRGGQELLSRAAAGAAAWRRERARERKQLDLADQLVALAKQLNSARTEAEIYEVVMRHAVTIVGGYASILLLPAETGGPLTTFETPLLPSGVMSLTIAPYRRLFRPGVIRAADAQADTGAPFSELAPLFAQTGAAALAHVPCGDGGVLLLVERRGERRFEPEDWNLFHLLMEQASVALERVQLLKEARELSLTDPLTGLGNRRRMEIFLEHSMAAARRGEPLSMVMIDLDGFKAVNDELGHLRGDRILAQVGECLRDQIRGADLAVRYGGDEFLLILPGSDLAGARALVARIRERLTEQVEISAGAAEYNPKMKSAEEFIEAADRELYAAKHNR